MPPSDLCSERTQALIRGIGMLVLDFFSFENMYLLHVFMIKININSLFLFHDGATTSVSPALPSHNAYRADDSPRH